MSTPDDGGMAFPIPIVSQSTSTGETTIWQTEGGMTLRDYFAAKAMSVKFGRSGTDISIESMAKNCYELADAMLEARKAAK